MKMGYACALLALWSLVSEGRYRDHEVSPVPGQSSSIIDTIGKAPGMLAEPVLQPRGSAMLQELPKLLSHPDPWRCEEIERMQAKPGQTTGFSDVNVRQVALKKIKEERGKSERRRMEFDLELLNQVETVKRPGSPERRLGMREMAERAMADGDLITVDRLANYFRGSDVAQTTPNPAPTGFTARPLADILVRHLIASLMDRGNIAAASFYFDGWMNDNQSSLARCGTSDFTQLGKGLFIYSHCGRQDRAKEVEALFSRCGKTPRRLESTLEDLTAQQWFTGEQDPREAVWVRRAVTFSGDAREFIKFVGLPGEESLPFCLAYDPVAYLKALAEASASAPPQQKDTWRGRLAHELAQSSLRSQPWAIRFLAHNLTFTNVETRKIVRAALRASGSAAIPSIVARLREGDVPFRSELYGLLAHLGKDGQKALLELASIPGASRNLSSIIGALGEAGDFHDPKMMDLLIRSADTTDTRLGDSVREALFNLPPSAVGLLLDRLKSPLTDPQKLILARGLRFSGDGVMPLLSSFLTSPSPEIVEEALRTLSWQMKGAKDPKIAAEMVRLLDHENLGVASTAASALRDGEESVLPLVLKRLADKRPLKEEVEEGLLWGMSHMGRGAIPQLLRSSNSPNAELRLAAIRGLSRMDHGNSAPVVECLLKALSDPDERVRLIAAEAIGKVGPSVADKIIAGIPKSGNQKGAFALALKHMGAKAIPPLMDFLKSPNEDERRYALLSLAELSAFADEKVATAIFSGITLDKEDPEKRNAVLKETMGLTMEALAAMAGKLSLDQKNKFIEFLISQKDNADHDKRYAATEALAKLGEAATPALLKLAAASEGDPNSASFAAASLLGHGPVAIPALLRTAARSPKPIVETVLQSLSENSDRVGSTKALVELSFVRSELGDEFLMYFASDPERFLPPLVQALQNPELRPQTLKYLGAMAGKSAPVLPQIFACLADGNKDVRVAAQDAILRIGDAAVPALKQALSDRNDLIYSGAARALLTLNRPLDEKTKRHLLWEVSSEIPARAELATRLLERDSASLLSELSEKLGDPSTSTRLRAIRALRGAGEAALPALERARRDSRPTVVRAAEAAIAALSK